MLPDSTAQDETPRAEAQSPSLADRIRERWKTPVTTEETHSPDSGKRPGRSPATEDLPSPRCVLADYRAGAAHYGAEAPLIAAAYWAVAALPLAWNMTAAACHVASQRPGRFWAFAAGAAVLIICLLVFG